MPSLSPYKSELDYGYAPGIFPSMECLMKRSDAAARLLISSSGEGREGVEKLCLLAREKHIRIEEADKALARISGKENCYAAVVFNKFSDILQENKPHVVLHNPSDCGNVGTILRTCLGFGIEDVALVRPCADVFDPRVVRASMGSIFSLRIHVYSSFEEYRREFAERRLYPFMLDSSTPLQEALAETIPENFSLIFGNEGRGLPHEFAEMGKSVRIESSDKVDSLNLSIAAAIGIYGFMKRKK